MKTIILTLILCLFPITASAQQTPTQKAADWTSTGLVLTNVTADSIYSFKHHCVKNLIFRNAFAIGVSEIGKLTIRESRPDGSDFRSFPSEHSAIAMSNAGWNFKFGFSIAIGAGSGRVIAKRHHVGDVIAGELIGIAAGYLFPCNAQ